METKGACSKPARPNNPYFQFRQDMLKQMPVDEKNKHLKIQLMWREMPEAHRKNRIEQFETEYAEWKVKMEEWKAKHGDDKPSRSRLKTWLEDDQPERSLSERRVRRNRVRKHQLLGQEVVDLHEGGSPPRSKVVKFKEEVSYLEPAGGYVTPHFKKEKPPASPPHCEPEMVVTENKELKQVWMDLLLTRSKPVDSKTKTNQPL